MARPHPSPPDGGATFPATGKVNESDLAYARAVEAINRIIRELDEILKGSKYDGKQPTSDAGADC